VFLYNSNIIKAAFTSCQQQQTTNNNNTRNKYQCKFQISGRKKPKKIAAKIRHQNNEGIGNLAFLFRVGLVVLMPTYQKYGNRRQQQHNTSARSHHRIVYYHHHNI
jgi:hypothetical protein